MADKKWSPKEAMRHIEELTSPFDKLKPTDKIIQAKPPVPVRPITRPRG